MDLLALNERVPEVSPDENLPTVLRRMSESGTHVAVVIENRRILGLIVERDATSSMAGLGRGTSAPRARDVMTASVEQMLASNPVIDAAREMRARRIPYLALVDEQKHFVGMVTLRRVLFEVMDELDLKVDNLERELMADGPGG